MRETRDRPGVIRRQLPSGAALAVSRYGGQVLSWRNAQGRELLYLSATSVGENSKPIRGGIPVCFPQFAARGPLPKHGLVRTRWWTEVANAAAGNAAVHLRLEDDAETRAIWPFRFSLDLHVVASESRLDIQLTVHNTDTRPWSFTAALHTYLRTDNVAQASLAGLAGIAYEDALRGGERVTSLEPTPDFRGAVDRVYQGAPSRLVLSEPGHSILIQQAGFADTVVWNPGPSGASALGDMPAGDEMKMLCVEAAQVVHPVQLEPGETWSGSQFLTLLPDPS